jgi:hypothetical protein
MKKLATRSKLGMRFGKQAIDPDLNFLLLI